VIAGDTITLRRGVLSWRADRVFYTAMSIAVVGAVFAGFARTYYLRASFQPTPLPLYLKLHGFAFTTWVGFFLAQTTLVAAGRTDIHRRLGWAGAGLAVLMVAAALGAATLSGHREVLAGHADQARTFLAVPIFSMLVFPVLVASAVYYRRYPETHKRLMLLATLSIIDAAVARWPIAWVATTWWAYYALTDVFVALAIGYDIVARQRVHPAYIWGGMLMVSAQVARELIGPTAAWHAFARALIG
jgi:hypothetical protein